MNHPSSTANDDAPAEPTPEGAHAPDLLAFQRRMAELGIQVRLPRFDPEWTPPDPLPIDADEMSRFLVELRHTGRL